MDDRPDLPDTDDRPAGPDPTAAGRPADHVGDGRPAEATGDGRPRASDGGHPEPPDPRTGPSRPAAEGSTLDVVAPAPSSGVASDGDGADAGDPDGAHPSERSIEERDLSELVALLTPEDVEHLLERGGARGLRSGESLGDFELLAPIGGGSMGDVWRARQTSLGRTVALKVLRREMAGGRARRLFEQEARAMARLRHPGIVTAHATGTTDGRMWIAQELIEGERSLADLLEEQRRADAEGEEPDEQHLTRTVRFFMGVADAVGYAHSQGVVHRDLKPGNVLIDEDGAPHVADFGLAALREEADQAHERRLIGTPCYMSPEQVAAQIYGIDERTDVFSIGVMLYETLSLERPFDSDLPDHDEARRAVFESIVTHAPRPVGTDRRRVPKKLQAIVDRCLQKDRARRYLSARDLAEDLGRFLENKPLKPFERPEDTGDATGEAYSPIAGHPGQFLDQFRLIRFIDRGSQGEVWEAFDSLLEKPVALKIVPIEGRSQAELDRFELEAKVTARCEHPGIVRINQYGESHGCMWIAMELVEEARTLRDRIAEEFGGLDRTASVDAPSDAPRDFAAQALFFAELADALAEVHAHRIVHRDIKPSNILIGTDGRGRITDFGTARVLDRLGPTQVHERVGTARYMSPEQINPELYDLDGRADVFALAICLYESLSGIHPFEADSKQLTQHKILHEEPLRLSRLVTRCPVDLERIVRRALSKVREDRYPSMEAFAADLRAFAAGLPIEAAGRSLSERLRRGVSERRRGLAAAAVLALAVLTGGALRGGGAAGEVEAARVLGRAEGALAAQRAEIADLLAGRERDVADARRAVARAARVLGAAAGAAPGPPRLLDGTSLEAVLESIVEASLTSELARERWAAAEDLLPLPPTAGLLPLVTEPGGTPRLALVATSPEVPDAGATVEPVRVGDALWLVGVDPLTPEHWRALTTQPWDARHAIDLGRVRAHLGWSDPPDPVRARAPYRGADEDRALRPVLGPFRPRDRADR